MLYSKEWFNLKQMSIKQIMHGKIFLSNDVSSDPGVPACYFGILDTGQPVFFGFYLFIYIFQLSADTF